MGLLTKDFGKITINMAKESFTSKMKMNMKARSIRTRLQAKVYLDMRMAIFIKENSKMAKKMVEEY